MTSLAKYHGRSPRYILDTEDESLVRVAGPKQIPWEEGTAIKNVSLTGLAFTAPIDLCPLLGEVIRIQFNPPTARQMACYAIVTRLEQIGSQSMLVGVHFYKMDMHQRIYLAQGLARRFKEVQDRATIEELFDKKGKPKLSLKRFRKWLTFNSLGLAWLFAIYAFLKFPYINF